MRVSSQRASLRGTVDATLKKSSRRSLRGLLFPAILEEMFEQDTRKQRSRRMWFEGLIAILGFNLCLLLDLLLVSDGKWLSVTRQTLLITPVAIAVNLLVRSNPSRAIREGSVALGMFAISIINLVVEGHASTAATLFGVICVLITAMFSGIVMRIRFRYMIASILGMLVAGICSLGYSPHLLRSEAMMADSMFTIGIVIIIVASISLELEERNGYLVSLQRNMQADELAWANQTLKELSNVDNLTQLPNRRALDERIKLLWKACAVTSEPLSIVIIDVDHFKLFNDTHGHLFGDEILRNIGSLLPQILHSDEDMAARFGGEEFVLLLPATMPNKAIAVAEAVRHKVQMSVNLAHRLPEGQVMTPVTVSCGVSTVVPGGILQSNDLISAADAALYLAKRGGRNRVEFNRCVEPTPTGIRTETTGPRSSRTSSRARIFGPISKTSISKLVARF